MDVCTENGSNGIVAARRIKEADPTVLYVLAAAVAGVVIRELEARKA